MDILDMDFDNSPLPFQLSSQVALSSYGFTRSNGRLKWAFGYEECEANYQIDRPEGFPFEIVEIILEGEGVARDADGTERPIKRGSTWKYGPATPIAFNALPSAPFRKIFIARIQSEPQEALFDAIESAVHDCSPRIDLIESLYRELVLTSRHRERFSDARSEALVNAVLALIGTCAASESPNPARERLARSAFATLENDFAKLQSVTQWAQVLEVSPNHLSRALKSHTGKAPYYILLDHKMNRAFHLLSAGVGNVKTIAAMVGFEDPFHFSRLFKKRFGFPPSQVAN